MGDSAFSLRVIHVNHPGFLHSYTEVFTVNSLITGGLESAFLETIRSEPNNPVRRLIYADWLEEQGDERCEIVRNLVSLGSVPVDDCHYVTKQFSQCFSVSDSHPLMDFQRVQWLHLMDGSQSALGQWSGGYLSLATKLNLITGKRYYDRKRHGNAIVRLVRPVFNLLFDEPFELSVHQDKFYFDGNSLEILTHFPESVRVPYRNGNHRCRDWAKFTSALFGRTSVHFTDESSRAVCSGGRWTIAFPITFGRSPND